MSSEGRGNPYVGPRAYEEGERQYFFGRDQETRQLAALVIAQRAVVLYAPSGAGKTSLLRAGVVPLLKEHHVVEPLPLSLVYIAGRHRLPKVSVFIAFIMEKFASAPWRVGK